MAEMTSVRARVTHKQKDQFEMACERFREQQNRSDSQEEIQRMLMGKFCTDQGVRFDRTRRGARPGAT